MKKIGIITFHRALNYGAILQAYALQRTLLSYGVEVEIVDYRCRHIETVYRPFDVRHCANIPAGIKKCVKSFQLIKKRQHFNEFQKNNLILSKKCKKKELASILNGYYAAISGSDQVFNFDATGGDLSYFLDVELINTRKYAYGASLGVSSVSDEQLYKIKSLLERFEILSMREQTGSDIVHKLTDKTVHTVLDPTFLLGMDEWRCLGQKPDGVSENYILTYMMDGSKYVMEKARALAEREKCQIVIINPTLKQQKENRDCILYPSISPEEFLWLFDNAKAVVTNSFHGLAFSSIFEKEFYVETSNKNKSSRITDLLEVMGKTDQLLPCDDVKEDYIYSNPALNKYKEFSFNILGDMVKGEKYE